MSPKATSISRKSRRTLPKAKKSRLSPQNEALLDLIAVIEHERRLNQTASVLSLHASEKSRYAWCARRGAMALATVRQALAHQGKGLGIEQSERQFDHYIDLLLDAEVDIDSLPLSHKAI